MPRRAVIVAGVRTPFVKAFGELLKLDTIALGVGSTKQLLERTEIHEAGKLADRPASNVPRGGLPNLGRLGQQGRQVPLADVTPELEAKMSPEEYDDYFELKGGGDEFEDEVF